MRVSIPRTGGSRFAPLDPSPALKGTLSPSEVERDGVRGPSGDPRFISKPAVSSAPASSAAPGTTNGTARPKVAGFPFDIHEARERQAAAASSQGVPIEKRIELGDGAVLELALIPAGEFLMGDTQGSEDERPPSRVPITRPFWMG